VSGIVATLEARHGIGAVSQKINNLALAFIAPLAADQYNTLTHLSTPETIPETRLI
jgi:hypothetical protein